MRPPAEAEIYAPFFPGLSRWVNVASLRMDKQRGRPVLVEFWDFCRVNSLRTLPYLKAWHERYAADGLRVVGVHAAGFEASSDPDAVKAAVARLGIDYPVLIDSELSAAEEYGIQGWPSRYLWDQESRLFEFHIGEGAYAETELAIQELLGIEREPLAPLRPEDEPGVLLPPQTEDQVGPWSGPYEAGAVWAVLSGAGTVRANGREIVVDHPGAYPLIEHERHTAGELALEVGDGVVCEAVCFTPGIAAAGSTPIGRG
ncbi:MAG TPA: redoxin domain-containing protein [Conexibacter sp.]|jgi:thiol-disulfide isomerase/thioredoxin